MEEKEVWKNIRGYEGLYQVSNLGRVKSLQRLRRNRSGMAMIKGRILSHNITKNGYHLVQLHNDGERKDFLVHRLVYAAFVGDIPEGFEINHRDECKDNNTLNNLDLMNHSENCNWATRNERCSRKLQKQVIMDGYKEFDSVSKAAEHLGCCIQAITNCCRNRIHSVFGHTFRYK